MRPVAESHAWPVQRATAVFMLGFLLWLFGALLVSPPESYEQWRAFVVRPAASTAFAMFFGASVFHVWVGVRNVLLDYVERTWTLVIGLGLAATALIMVGIWLALLLVALHVR
jgi:succinate dehydrogenase / fumarate reductase membrane anchor subunit